MRTLAATGLLLLACTASAQVASSPDAIYHGILEVRRARGTLDRRTGNALLQVRDWRFILTPGTNGLFPDQEPILITMEGDPGFLLPAGMLRKSRKGNTFTYRAPRSSDPRSIRLFRLKVLADGSWLVRFKLRGLTLSGLIVQDPICLPLAVIIGDDDGFSGVEFTSPSFRSRRVRVASECVPPGNEWPWL
jgi:hypothetical protein